MTTAIAVLLSLLLLKFATTVILDMLNMKSVRAHADRVPDAFKSFMDEPTYRKGVNYTLDNTRFGIIENAFSTLLIVAILALYILPYLFNLGLDIFGTGIWGQAMALIFVTVLLSIPEIPFELYDQFVIEQKYGFNKSSFALWLTDKIKSLIIGIIIGAPLLVVIIWFFEYLPNTWWIWGFGVVALFQIVMMVLYPRLIIPLFNKLEDLPEGETKDALFKLAERGGFKARTIQVIDGSKRSSHSNAYFTGFGRFRRIVLFDTLLEQLTLPELEAVLAHEIGHYRKGHIVKMILANFAMTFATFALMGWLASSDWFYVDFGFEKSNGFGSVLLMFSLFMGAFTFWLSPLMNAFSRRNEYEADAFSAELCDGGDSLISALRKLNKENLGNLTPHKIYSAFHYSHPTLLERESALKDLKK